MPALDPSRDHIHLIGIGGAGLSAIARVLHERGFHVSGSDRQLSPLAAGLRAAGVEVAIGHAAAHVQGATLVVRSSAIPDDHVEVQAARAQGIPVLKRDALLGELMAGSMGIAIAGTHGKTTTTSMLAWMLTALGQHPTFIAGGVVGNLDTNARAGGGPHFVIEADEYDHMFLGLRPTHAVVTHVEHDHPDCFPTPEDFAAAFERFVALLPPAGTLLACADEEGAAALLHAEGLQARPLSYGLSPTADYQARALVPVSGAGFIFEACRGAERLARVDLLVPGEHNVRNALAAFALGDVLGLPAEPCAAALSAFRGVGRRFEVRGEEGGVIVIDDYAHHPTEIRATLAAARQRYPGRPLWVAWQPHTYSRARALLTGFAGAFAGAGHLVITDIYAARETAPADFSIETVLAAFEKQARIPVAHISGLPEAAEYLLARLRPGAVLLTLSAGDATEISEIVLKNLSKPDPARSVPHG